MGNLDLHSLDFDCECGKGYRVLVKERDTSGRVTSSNVLAIQGFIKRNAELTDRIRELEQQNGRLRVDNQNLNYENGALKTALLEMCNHAKAMEFHIQNHEGYLPAHLAMWPKDACAGIALLDEKQKKFFRL